MYNFPLNFWCSGYSISLQIQTFCTYNVQNFPLNFRSSGHLIFLPIHPFRRYIMYTISSWIFRSSGYSIFSANPDIPYIYNVHNFPVEFPQFRHSIFLQIQTFRTYNVHNFPLNLRSFGQSIFLQILTFRPYNVHNSP